MRKWMLLTLCCLSLSGYAETLAVKANAPAVYTVQPGDTLMGIAYRYLEDPSDWDALVEKNPQLKNPYILYPGDVLTLRTNNGTTSLTVTEGGTVKLTPEVRSYPLDKPIPIIPLSFIKPFLNGAIVVEKNELADAPYIVAHGGKHLTTGAGDQIYVMALPPSPPGKEFAIYRQGDPYIDPTTKAILGYKATHIGFAELGTNGSPATMLITESTREVLTGDRLQPSLRAQINYDFVATTPSVPIKGQIIDVLEGVTQIGRYQIVVIDRGRLDGFSDGNILNIYQLGETIEDPIKKQKVTLPNEHVGQLMVFRTFPQVSYAIILVASSPIHTFDMVQGGSGTIVTVTTTTTTK